MIVEYGVKDFEERARQNNDIVDWFENFVSKYENLEPSYVITRRNGTFPCPKTRRDIKYYTIDLRHPDFDSIDIFVRKKK